MIEVSRARKILGKIAERYNDSEIEQMINALVVLADLTINSYLDKKEIDLKRTNGRVDISKQQ